MSEQTHDLKCWPEVFSAFLSGEKTAEFRRDDRGFAVGDTLLQREYSPATDSYSGRTLKLMVTHKVPGGQFGIPEGFCVLSVAPAAAPKSELSRRAREASGCVAGEEAALFDDCAGSLDAAEAHVAGLLRREKDLRVALDAESSAREKAEARCAELERAERKEQTRALLEAEIAGLVQERDAERVARVAAEDRATVADRNLSVARAQRDGAQRYADEEVPRLRGRVGEERAAWERAEARCAVLAAGLEDARRMRKHGTAPGTSVLWALADSALYNALAAIDAQPTESCAEKAGAREEARREDLERVATAAQALALLLPQVSMWPGPKVKETDAAFGVLKRALLALPSASADAQAATPEEEGYEDEAFCDHCGQDTRQRFHDSGHERDSSNDWRECLVCHWVKFGYADTFSPPLGSD